MVMFGIKLTGQVPFSEVFCHAMIRDAHGRKMSKSLGNVIDPVDVIEGIALDGLHAKLLEGNLDPREVERAKAGQKADYPKGIPQCGTDALRFALCAYTTGGRDINLDILRVEGYRKFCNKIWNATRFAMMKLGDGFKPNASAQPTGRESLADLWVLAKLNKAAKETNKCLAERNFMGATNAVYQFWLYELCDVYIEHIKPVCDGSDEVAKRTAQDTLYTCLEGALKLLHPFMPFVTEELYQRLERRPGDTIPTIVKAPYPVEEAAYANDEAEQQFDNVFEVVRTIRSLAVQHSIKKDGVVTVYAKDAALAKILEGEQRAIQTLAKLKELTIANDSANLPTDSHAGAAVKDTVTVYLRQ